MTWLIRLIRLVRLKKKSKRKLLKISMSLRAKLREDDRRKPKRVLNRQIKKMRMYKKKMHLNLLREEGKKHLLKLIFQTTLRLSRKNPWLQNQPKRVPNHLKKHQLLLLSKGRRIILRKRSMR
jgi:DNA polymerase I-like protein with 3'-5' exonuclease and polymerase domains